MPSYSSHKKIISIRYSKLSVLDIQISYLMQNFNTNVFYLGGYWVWGGVSLKFVVVGTVSRMKHTFSTSISIIIVLYFVGLMPTRH